MTNSNIVDRVVERLKAQPIGDLITEEDLHDIVKQAIPKTFFEERHDPNNRNYGAKPLPPLIVEMMQGLLKDQAKQAVEDWIRENPEIVLDYWKKVCDDKLLTYVNAIMDERATASVKVALRGVLQTLNDERIQKGLPLLSQYF